MLSSAGIHENNLDCVCGYSKKEWIGEIGMNQSGVKVSD